MYSQPGYPVPLTTGKHFLVHSAGLPEEFLLFAPDTATQILFNPARANDYSKSFVFINYLSDYNYSNNYPVYLAGYSPVIIQETEGLKKNAGFNFPQIYQELYTAYKNPSFSAAALFNTGSAKWLFQLANGIITASSSMLYNNYQFDVVDPAAWYTNNKSNSNQDYHDDESVTSIKISRIFKADELNLSVGLFGIIRSDHSGENVISTNEQYSLKNAMPTDSLSFREKAFQSQLSTSEDNYSRYVIGLEFTAGTKNFDYIGSIDYQFGNNSSRIKNNIYGQFYDSSRFSPTMSWDFNRWEEFRNGIGDLSDEPSIINFSNYFRHTLGLILPEDNLFISANAFYAAGNISYAYNEERISLLYSEDQTTGDTTNNTNSNKYDINDWGVTISAGYALSKTINELSFLTGFRIMGNIEHLDGIEKNSAGSNLVGYMEDVLEPSMFLVTLPVYLNFSPADWVSVYGGLNYSYVYRNQESRQSMNGVFHETYTPSEITSDLKYESLNQGWSSYKSIYFGCELRHSSGFRAQFLFDGDIANVPDWNVSLGYVF